MPLSLSYVDIANWERVCYVDDPESGKRVDHPFNFTMGMFMMHTGINALVRGNAPEFYMRAKLIEACFGSLFTNGDGTPRLLQPQDVINYIGLTSNVSRYTRPQFWSHLREVVSTNLNQTMLAVLASHDAEIKARVLATAAADPVLSRFTGDGHETCDPEEHGIIQE